MSRTLRVLGILELRVGYLDRNNPDEVSYLPPERFATPVDISTSPMSPTTITLPAQLLEGAQYPIEIRLKLGLMEESRRPGYSDFSEDTISEATYVLPRVVRRPPGYGQLMKGFPPDEPRPGFIKLYVEPTDRDLAGNLFPGNPEQNLFTHYVDHHLEVDENEDTSQINFKYDRDVYFSL